MSYGTYMAGPPPDDKRCPHCGAALKPGRARCWLCQEETSIREGAPEPRSYEAKTPTENLRQSPDDAAVWVLTLGLALIIAGGAAMTCGAVGLMIVAPIAAAPIFIRIVVSRWRRSREEKWGSLTGAQAGMAAVGLTIAVGLAAFIAYFALCTAWFNAQPW